MVEEEMTPEERMLSAINLNKPDRVPIRPLIMLEAAAGILNLSKAEIYSNTSKGLDAIFRVYDEFGGWDALNRLPEGFPLMYTLGGLGVELPGKELPEGYSIQFLEKETMKLEDYKKIAEKGWRNFLEEDFIFRVSDFKSGAGDLDKARERFKALQKKCSAGWKKRGSFLRVPSSYMHPFFKLSLNRNFKEFTKDLYNHPKLVEKAMEKMTTNTIERGIRNVNRFGGRCIYLIEERAEAFFYPLEIFERFWWPYTKRIVDEWWSEGIITWFHLDQCWDKNIPYFKKLPKRSAVISLDGSTDIFAAKKTLKNHLCIASDVNASLLTLGEPKEVEAYCKKLIDKLGSDGGHILASGCEVPPKCKSENLQAMIETGKNYGKY